MITTLREHIDYAPRNTPINFKSWYESCKSRKFIPETDTEFDFIKKVINEIEYSYICSFDFSDTSTTGWIENEITSYEQIAELIYEATQPDFDGDFNIILRYAKEYIYKMYGDIGAPTLCTINNGYEDINVVLSFKK